MHTEKQSGYLVGILNLGQIYVLIDRETIVHQGPTSQVA